MKLKNKKMIILFSAIVLICFVSIIVVLKIQFTENDYKKAIKNSNSEENIDNIKANFNSVFQNDISGNIEDINLTDQNKEIVYTAAEKIEVIPNVYDLDVQIPQFNINSTDINKCNSEIKSIFQNKASNILSQKDEYTIYKVKYHVYINNNIISLIIKSNLKEGENPDRVIIKTYNYNTETKKIMTINDVAKYKNFDLNNIQNEITEEIENQIEYSNKLKVLGYQTYSRDSNNNMYKVENTTNFILGENEELYLIYAYGNLNYTSEMDLVVIK